MATDDELSEGQLAGIVDALAIPLIVLDRDGLVLHTNEAADDRFPVMEGDPWIDIVPAEARGAAEAAIERARENESATFHCRHADRDWRITVQPTHAGLVVTAQEPEIAVASGEAERVAAERARLERVTGEMEHRVANLLSMVPAIVKLSLRRATDVRSARERVVSRVSALAAAHSAMLTSEAIEDGVSLDAMIGAVLHAHQEPGGNERFVASGPPVRLATRGSNTVALALHELAANAAEFGALSTPTGRVRLAWAIENSARDVKLPQGAQSVLRLLWSETGGPPLAGRPPATRGFGTDVIDRLIVSQGGAIEREWRLHGLDVTIDLPLYELGQEPRFSQDMTAGTRPKLPENDEAATRIVERAVNSVGGTPGLPPSGAEPAPVQGGPSEDEILSKLDRIIANASASDGG